MVGAVHFIEQDTSNEIHIPGRDGQEDPQLNHSGHSLKTIPQTPSPSKPENSEEWMRRSIFNSQAKKEKHYRKDSREPLQEYNSSYPQIKPFFGATVFV